MPRLRIQILAGALFLIPPGVAQQAPLALQEHLRAAQADLDSEKYAGAVRELRTAPTINWGSPFFRINLHV